MLFAPDLRSRVVRRKMVTACRRARQNPGAQFPMVIFFFYSYHLIWTRQPRFPPEEIGAGMKRIPLIVSDRMSTNREFKNSAIYTPYHLTPGGGERVLLNFAKKFHQINPNEEVHFLVEKNNVCRNIGCLRDLSVKLAVDGINWQRIRIKLRKYATPTYNIWFSMGNDLLPRMQSLGALLDLSLPVSFLVRILEPQFGTIKLSTYDIVYLNSQYTYSWYRRYLDGVINGLLPLKAPRYADYCSISSPFRLVS